MVDFFFFLLENKFLPIKFSTKKTKIVYQNNFQNSHEYWNNIWNEGYYSGIPSEITINTKIFEQKYKFSFLFSEKYTIFIINM